MNGRYARTRTDRQQRRDVGEPDDRLGVLQQGLAVHLRQNPQQPVPTSRQEDRSALGVRDGGIERLQPLFVATGQKALPGVEVGRLEAQIVTSFESLVIRLIS
jgi:hypothetical protein